MDYSMLLFVLLGGLTGVLSGLLGLGGGVVMVPALVFVFGMSQHMAEGTTLALMVPPIGLLAAWMYYRQGHVHLRTAALICLGFTIGGYFGADLAVFLSNVVLARVFGGALFLIALKVLMSEYQAKAAAKAECKKYSDHFGFWKAVALVLLGVAVGAVSGLIGLGGGVMLVPALVFLFGMCQHEAQGTTLALMVPPIGIFAALEYYQQGDVNLQVAALICAGFFFGGLLGAQLATRMSSRWLSLVFGVSMILIALKMIFGV